MKKFTLLLITLFFAFNVVSAEAKYRPQTHSANPCTLPTWKESVWSLLASRQQPKTTCAEPLDAIQTEQQLLTGLRMGDETLLRPVMADTMQVGLEYGAWWDGWETWSEDEMLTQLTVWGMNQHLFWERIPNEPLWYMENLNPYTDLFPEKNVVDVFIMYNFNQNDDAQAILFITEQDGTFVWDALLYSSVGMMRQ